MAKVSETPYGEKKVFPGLVPSKGQSDMVTGRLLELFSIGCAGGSGFLERSALFRA
jgi:hypothetical protein